jgi:D-alanine-D-alanine ligase
MNYLFFLLHNPLYWYYMLSILLLAGGSSDERAVSLRSGAAVCTALQAGGYQVKVVDPADGLAQELLESCDVVFPVLHGFGGEDGSVQQLLDDLGLCYVGSGVAASQVCFDKWAYKALLQKHELPVPGGELVTASSLRNSPLIKQPFVLKPYDGGSSVDTFIVRDVAQVDWSALETSLKQYSEMLLEALIEGAEITVGVLGDTALPVIEIIPPASGEFDYDNKYNGKTQELCPPKHISANVQKRAQDLALQIHRLCGCRDFSRTDFIVTNTDELRILETNTIPGMTEQSLLPKAAATAGFSMEQTVDQLVKLALARKTT